jgi:hypothetical protein
MAYIATINARLLHKILSINRRLEEFQLYVVQSLQTSELSSAHKKVLDERLAEAEKNPDNYISLDELKHSIRRK